MSDIAAIVAGSIGVGLALLLLAYAFVKAIRTSYSPEIVVIETNSGPVPEPVQGPVQGPVYGVVMRSRANLLQDLAQAKRDLRNMNESTLKFATTDQYMEAKQQVEEENPTASPSTRRLKTIALLQKQGVAPLMKRKSRSRRSR